MRLAYRLYRLASGTRHWLTRRLTPAGWLALVGLTLSGAIGVDLDQSVAGQAFAVVFCLLAVARLAALCFRGRFSAERLLPRLASAGQPLAYRVRVRNHSARDWRDLELLEDLADPRPTLAQFVEMTRAASVGRSFRLTRKPAPRLDQRVALRKPAPLPVLARHGEAEARVEVLPLRRGPLRFEGLSIARRDPLGLVRGFVSWRSPQTVLILPKRYPLPPLPLPGAHKYQLGGVALAASVGESEEFVSLRDYRAGDPLRHVHWRSTARVGHPIVKEFEDEFFVRHALILDTFAGPGATEAFEEAVSLAASFACTVDTQESLLDLMFIGPHAVCFTAGRSVGHAEQALEILAAVQPCRSRPFTALEALVLQHAPVVSGCICLLLAWDEPRRELIRKLGALGLPLLVWVVTDVATAREISAKADDDRPVNFHVFVAGKIDEGLRRLERPAA